MARGRRAQPRPSRAIADRLDSWGLATRRRLRRLTRPAPLRGLRRLAPVSDKWGHDRGTPVDRWYIERFLERQAGDIRGRVLSLYTFLMIGSTPVGGAFTGFVANTRDVRVALQVNATALSARVID